MGLLLVILFIVVPIAELYVIIKVGELIGVWPTIGLLLAGALFGSWLLRHQGRSAWRRFNEAIGQRRFPGKEVADGALIIVGGTLLLTPGFLTDIVGIVLLVPPTRALVRRFMLGRFTVVSVGGFPRSGPGAGGAWGGRGREAESRPYDFDGTAEEEPPGGPSGRELPGEHNKDD